MLPHSLIDGSLGVASASWSSSDSEAWLVKLSLPALFLCSSAIAWLLRVLIRHCEELTPFIFSNFYIPSLFRSRAGSLLRLLLNSTTGFFIPSSHPSIIYTSHSAIPNLDSLIIMRDSRVRLRHTTLKFFFLQFLQLRMQR